MMSLSTDEWMGKKEIETREVNRETVRAVQMR